MNIRINDKGELQTTASDICTYTNETHHIIILRYLPIFSPYTLPSVFTDTFHTHFFPCCSHFFSAEIFTVQCAVQSVQRTP